MLASKEYGKLILRTKNAERIKTLIPNSMLSDQHENTIYVPWDIQTCRKLVSLGYSRVISPMEKDYVWAGGKTPYAHQKEQAAACTLNNRLFILSGLGSGKTHSALWAADYLMQIKEVRRGLILAQLSTLDCVWGDTLFTDFYHRKFAVLYGDAKKRVRLFKDKKYDFYIINHDAFGVIKDEFMARSDIDLIIIDESTAYKNNSTLRFKRLRDAIDVKKPSYIWALTATPTPNEPTDAWGQARLLHTHQGITATRFKEMVMQKVSMFKWVPRSGAHKIVAGVLSPSIRFETRECIDLPETIYSTRQAQLTPIQTKAFHEMVNRLSVEFSGGAANAVNEADKQNKLLQIACGFVYTRDDVNNVVTEHIDPSSRLKVLDEVLETVEGKVIIFVPYTELLSILHTHLSKTKQCELVYGATSKNERYRIFTEFQTTDKPDVIIAHPRTMAHGIDLTASATIIWYAPYASNEYYNQANGRIVRPKQTKITNIVHIEATELEKRLYKKLQSRQETQGTLLSYLKELQNVRREDR